MNTSYKPKFVAPNLKRIATADSRCFQANSWADRLLLHNGKPFDAPTGETRGITSNSAPG